MERSYKSYNIEELNPGDHLCVLYKTDEEHKALITPYLRSGLENNEKVFYIVDARTSETVLNYLCDDGMEVDTYLESGQLSMLTVSESYMNGGVFDPDGMIRMLTEETEKALKEGYAALRVTGEMSWALRGLPGSERLIEYETKLNEFFPTNKALAICQYDCRVFEPEILLDILTTHPIAVIGTEIYENFYYVPTEDFLAGKGPKRTLEHWIENLKLRKKAELDLKASEEKYRQLVENAQEGIWSIDTEAKTTFVNPRMAEILGYDVDEMMGHSLFSFMDERGVELANYNLERGKQGLKKQYDFEFIRKDGNRVYTSLETSPIIDDEKYAGAIAMVSDITNRKKMENTLRKSEERYSLTLDAVNDGLWEWDVLSGDAFFSPNYYKLLGYYPGEFPANYETWRSLVHPDDMDSTEKKLQKSIKSGKGFEIDLRMKTKSGQWLWVSTRGKAVEKDSTETTTRMLGTLSNIDHRKKVEEEIKWLSNVVESSDDAIITKSLKGDITTWNKGAELTYGYSAEEVIGKNISILAPLSLKDEFNQLIKKIKDGKKIFNYETIRLRKDGKQIDVSINISPIFDNYGNLVGVSAITRDITQSKKSELDLKESEEKFREVFNNANDAMFLHKLEDGEPGNFFEVNDVACQTLGYSRNELLNMSPMDIDAPETIAQIPLVMENLLKAGKTTFEAVQVTKDGELLSVEVNAHIFTIRGEEYILSISRDIRERKKAENALKESEIKYRNIFENVQDIFYQTDILGNIIEISPSVERYSGYNPAELIGKPVETVYSNPEDRKNLLKKIEKTGEVFGYELKLKTKSRELLYVSVNAHFLFDSSKNPIGIEGSLRDITERKNIEIQLKNSIKEKEMLLKEIHHRVKNNLMIISSLLNLQSRQIKDKASKDIFKESQNRARSMALIHERLYQSTDLKRIDFGDYIGSLSKELFHTYAGDLGHIELKVNVDDIFLDINTAIPLGLIVNELITNSLKHAFPEGKMGEINIDFHPQDDHFEFSVKDNGIGFPKDLDFHNTNSLGMQMVTSLTDQIDGEIELNRSQGTEFKITFKDLDIK